MTATKDMSTNELAKQAAAHVGPDDDWGMSLRQEAQDELARRERVIHQLNYPLGEVIPLAPLKERIESIIDGLPLSNRTPIVEAIMTEIARQPEIRK